MSIIILPELLLANFSWSTSVDRVKQCLGVVLKPHWKISKLLCLTNQQSPHIQPFLEWFMFKKSNFIRMLKAPYSWLLISSIKIWRWLKMNVFVWFIFNCICSMIKPRWRRNISPLDQVQSPRQQQCCSGGI